MRHFGHLLLIVLVLCQAAPTLARGQSSPRDQARKHFYAGEASYRTGSFREAVRSYQAALKLDPQPALIFNVAQCHRQLGERKKALFYYRLYLSDWQRKFPSRPIPYDKEVQGHIKKLEAGLEAEAGRAEQDRQAREARAAANAWRPITGWTLAGVGLASLAASVATGVMVDRTVNDYEAGAAGGMVYSDLKALEQDGERYQTAHLATLIGGAVLAAAGTGLLVWHYLLDSESGAAEVALAPGVAPGGFMLAGEVRF